MLYSIAQTDEILRQHILPWHQAESIHLASALGRVLAEDICADRDMPPFDRATMDGIAIAYEQYAQGQREFGITHLQYAGAPAIIAPSAIHATEIMTGAVCPIGLDTVVRYEDLEWLEIHPANSMRRIARIKSDVVVAPKQNIHPQGVDAKAGDTLIRAGTLLHSVQIAVCASVGKAQVQVRSLPSIGIISTGDELVSIEQTPLTHQIRLSNQHMVSAMLIRQGYTPQGHHLKDAPIQLREAMAEALSRYPVIITTGGVSAGKTDYLPQLFEEAGVRPLIRGVAQRPGKPLWVGRTEANIVFGLPGNPVSSFVGCLRYVIPYLHAMMGLPPKPRVYARLSENYHFAAPLGLFLGVRLRVNEQGECWAMPQAGNGSGDYANLLNCSGFLELPAERTHFYSGEAYPYWEI